MKKIISIAIIVSLIVVFSACESKTGKTTDENNESVSIMGNGTGELNLSMTEKDLTVKVKNNVIDENNKVALNIDSQADFYKVYENVEELINSDATTIVFGEITDLNYTNLEQGIYTNLSVTIKESLKGDLKADDIISVFENGGISTYNV